MDRLEDLREEQRTPIGTAVSVLLFAADGPVATELFSDLAAMAIPYEATAMIGDIHYLAAADGNQMSAVEAWASTPAGLADLGRSTPTNRRLRGHKPPSAIRMAPRFPGPGLRGNGPSSGLMPR